MTNANEKSSTQHTVVILVLDKSGSMKRDRDAVISGFNEQVQTLKKHAAEAGQMAVSLIAFSDPASIETVFAHQPASAAAELTEATYRPDGSTALFDAINDGIELAQTHPRYKDETTAVLLLAFTDGEENASAKVSGAQLRARIKELEASERWTVTLLGPDGVQKTAADLALRADNVMAMAMDTSGGKTEAFLSMSLSTASYMTKRGAGERGSGSFYGDEKKRRGQPTSAPKEPPKP